MDNIEKTKKTDDKETKHIEGKDKTITSDEEITSKNKVDLISNSLKNNRIKTIKVIRLVLLPLQRFQNLTHIVHTV